MTQSSGPLALVGRDRELTELSRFVDEARTDGSALLLSGDAGVGKTALMAAAIEMATGAGMRVVRGSGVEYEARSALRDALESYVPDGTAAD